MGALIQSRLSGRDDTSTQRPRGQTRLILMRESRKSRGHASAISNGSAGRSLLRIFVSAREREEETRGKGKERESEIKSRVETGGRALVAARRYRCN